MKALLLLVASALLAQSACGSSDGDSSLRGPPSADAAVTGMDPPEQPDATATSSPVPDSAPIRPETSGCRDVGTNCFDDPTSCCPGAVCARDVDDPSRGFCATVCTTSSDCGDGCCVEFGLNRICAEPGTSLCGPACATQGESCENTPCCADHLCTSSALGSTCAALCSDDSDCASGCCEALGGSTESVCLEPEICSSNP